MPGADPTTTITDAGAALRVALALIAATGDDPGNPAHAYWRSSATAPLAALLFSASPQGNGAGITWARTILDHPGAESARAVDIVLATHADDVSAFYLESAWLRATGLRGALAASINAIMRAALNPAGAVAA